MAQRHKAWRGYGLRVDKRQCNQDKVWIWSVISPCILKKKNSQKFAWPSLNTNPKEIYIAD
jgi:hypothetical protein